MLELAVTFGKLLMAHAPKIWEAWKANSKLTDEQLTQIVDAIEKDKKIVGEWRSAEDVLKN